MLLKSKKFVNASLWQSANKRCLPFPPHTNSPRSGKVVRALGEVHAALPEHFILSFRRDWKPAIKSLALSASYDRLATVCGHIAATLEVSSVAAVGKISSLCVEVTLGPRSSLSHLADHVYKHILLFCQKMVVTYGCVCRRRRNRSSFHNHIHFDGNRFCGGAGVLWGVCVEVTGAKILQESALHSRQKNAGTWFDYPDRKFVFLLLM